MLFIKFGYFGAAEFSSYSKLVLLCTELLSYQAFLWIDRLANTRPK